MLKISIFTWYTLRHEHTYGNSMKNRITITLAWYTLATLALLFVVGIVSATAGGYLLYKRIVATEEFQKRIIVQQAAENKKKTEEEAIKLAAQKEELSQTKEALEQARQESAQTSAKIQTLSKTLETQSQMERDIVISSNDLFPFVTGVVQVVCATPQGISSGSGSLFTFKEVGYAVLTNHHVVEDASKCAVVMTNTANATIGMFSLANAIYTYNQNTDEAILSIGTSLSTSNIPIANYNYSVASSRRCLSLMPVGTPVVIVGFPAYAKRDALITIETIGTVNSIYRTVTNGIVSGYDTSKQGEANYFVSAKIDSGNSGGIALAKDKNGLCVLGLPTWLTMGNYETQGLVQNITNLLPKN